MSADTYTPPDLDSDGWTSEPDTAARYRRPFGGPLPRDEVYDDTVANNREQRRMFAPAAEPARFSGRAAATVIVLGTGVTAVTWVFAGGLVAAALAGSGVALWAGNRLIGVRAAARRRERDAGQQNLGRRASGQRGLLGSLLGGGTGRGGLGGLGRLGGGLGGGGRGRRGGGGGGMGPRGNGPRGGGGGGRLGAAARRAAGSMRRPGSGASRGPAGAGNAARSGGLPSSGGKPGRSLRNLLPKGKGKGNSGPATSGRPAGPKGSAARTGSSPKGNRPGRNPRTTGGTGGSRPAKPYVPGRIAASMPGSRGRAARTARALARARRGPAATGGYVPGRLAASMPGRRGAAARTARAHARANGTLPRTRVLRRAARVLRHATITPVVAVAVWGLWKPIRWVSGRAGVQTLLAWADLHLLYAPRRAAARWSVAGLRWADQHLLTRPNEFLRQWAATKWANHHLYARGRAIYGRAGSRWRAMNWFAPQWLLDARLLSALQGRRAAFAALLMGLLSSVAGFFTWFITGYEGGRRAAAGRHPLDPDAVTADHAHARHPDQLATEVLYEALNPRPTAPAGARPAAQPPATPAPAAAAPQPTTEGVNVSRSTRSRGPAVRSDLLDITDGLHPTQSGMLEDARYLHGQFRPRSFPDLSIYLASMPDALYAEQGYWKALAGYLHSTFPGFNLVQDFAYNVEVAYSKLGGRAAGIFAGYKDKHGADFARHLDTEQRINEKYADVKRWGGNESVASPMLSIGGRMHGAHTLWLSSCEMNLGGFRPENTEDEDRWEELRWWLTGLPAFFASRARFAQHFVQHGLVGEFPIEDGVADITIQMSVGWCELADQSVALHLGFENRNAHDKNRRDNPKPNEYKRDVGNHAMSHA